MRIAGPRSALTHASDLADSVVNGSISLENAYEEARLRKGRSETHESRFNVLKAQAPDLAETCLSVCFVSEQTLATTITRWPRVWFPNRPPAWSISSQLWTHFKQLLKFLRVRPLRESWYPSSILNTHRGLKERFIFRLLGMEDAAPQAVGRDSFQRQGRQSTRCQLTYQW
jgi:hypothetical protein